MITTEFCSLMAEYNQWMNERLYALCAPMSDAERKRDRGAFFGSLHGTLDHILFGDLANLSRFTGDPPEPPHLGVVLHEDFERLREQRREVDARITQWAGGVTGDWLAASLTFVSRIDAKTRTLPRWVLATQMFNHQTHHRGQITTMLTQMGIDIGTTDVPFMPRFVS